MAGLLVAGADREAGGEPGGPVHLSDDDPLIRGAAVRLVLDHPPGELVAGQPWRGLAGRQRGGGGQFHQLAGPHAGHGRDDQQARGAGDFGEVDDLEYVQGQRPRTLPLPSAIGMRAASRPHSAAAPTWVRASSRAGRRADSHARSKPASPARAAIWPRLTVSSGSPGSHPAFSRPRTRGLASSGSGLPTAT